MQFTQTRFDGAWLIDVERHQDDRGFFARTWCAEEFDTHGLNSQLVQCNISFNHIRGTLRGMHFQKPPFAECKLVRCTQGAIFDVIIDIRRDSPTFGHWQGFELSAKNQRALYIPEGFAHGFQTLTDGAEVFYQMSLEHHPSSASGLRWNDPTIAISWPLLVSMISDKDQSWPDLAHSGSSRNSGERSLLIPGGV